MSYKNTTFSERKPIKIVLFTSYELVCHQLKVLIERKSEIRIQDFASSSAELLEKLSINKPDVVVFCLIGDELDNIDLLPRMFQAAPNAKAVVLTVLNNKEDETKALKLGASGVVGTHQNEDILIRAIRQVAKGGVFLNRYQDAKLQRKEFDQIDLQDNFSVSSKMLGVYKQDPLTSRELEVIEVLAEGLNNKEISKKLFISEATVRTHLSSVYGKLNVEDRLNLVIYAYQYDIVDRLESKF